MEEDRPVMDYSPGSTFDDLQGYGINPLSTYSGYSDLPKASANYVFALNTAGGSVTVIDAAQATVQVLDTGDRPQFVETFENEDAALVLNSGSDDASLVRVDDEGTASVSTVDVVHGANHIAVAPDGTHGIVFFDASRHDLNQIFGDLQTVNVLRMQDGVLSAATISVGFKPRGVFFDSDSTNAYVVTDDGVSVIEFAQTDLVESGIARNVEFDISNSADDMEMFMVTRDGRYAIFKTWYDEIIHQVDLVTGEEDVLDLSSYFTYYSWENKTPYWPTEVWEGIHHNISFTTPVYNEENSNLYFFELSQSKLLQIPIPDGITEPYLATLVSTDFLADRTAPNLQSGEIFLFRQDVGSEWLGILDMNGIPEGFPLALPDTDTETDSDSDTDTDMDPDSDTDTETDTGVDTDSALVVLAMHKGIRQIYPSPTGTTVIVQHSKKNGNPSMSGISDEVRIDRSWGYSFLKPGTLDRKLELTETDLHSVVFLPDQEVAYLLFASESPAVREVLRVNLDSFKVDPAIVLETTPVSAGFVPGQNKVFVNQDHPEGRITFIDVNTGEIATVTGFVLNSMIKN